MNTFTETRNIHLPKGGVLEVQMTAEFVKRVRNHFSMPESEQLTDDHVRMFVYGVTESAIKGAEHSR